ncbi:uncharacterized protein LOC121237889 isoform X2 [Juglans microcarpa x Juglans regia]|uniref:uncharacterized protein LOC121237889 isoform X2 n=1 Tax=Juglans microcarpa x Juglans regia TaxID=2249226 RepID=UPI001B7F413C|nr:uncharacterized protein LOC121237889 isoform X2 [Juglans microcarpa x Juglans regia]
MDSSLIVNFIRFPTAKQAYAHVRREDVRQTVMASGAEATSGGVVMATKGIKSRQFQTLVKSGSLSLSGGKSNSSARPKGQSDGGKCTHCGNAKHTRDTCFKLHGYPDWWHELQARKKRDPAAIEEGTGRAVVVTAEPQLSLIPLAEPSTSLTDRGYSQQGDHWAWY